MIKKSTGSLNFRDISTVPVNHFHEMHTSYWIQKISQDLAGREVQAKKIFMIAKKIQISNVFKGGFETCPRLD